MKVGPITKPDKRNKTMSKKIDNGVMRKNCDAIVIFPIYGKFGAIQKSSHEKGTKRSLTQLLHYCFE